MNKRLRASELQTGMIVRIPGSMVFDEKRSVLHSEKGAGPFAAAVRFEEDYLWFYTANDVVTDAAMWEVVSATSVSTLESEVQRLAAELTAKDAELQRLKQLLRDWGIENE